MGGDLSTPTDVLPEASMYKYLVHMRGIQCADRGLHAAENAYFDENGCSRYDEYAEPRALFFLAVHDNISCVYAYHARHMF